MWHRLIIMEEALIVLTASFLSVHVPFPRGSTYPESRLLFSPGDLFPRTEAIRRRQGEMGATVVP